MTRRKISRISQVDNLSEQLSQQLRKAVAVVSPYRQELAGLALSFITLMVFLNLLGLASGFVTDFFGQTARSLLGWGTIPTMVAIGLLGLQMMRGFLEENARPISLEVVIGAELALISGLAVAHLLLGGADPLATAREYGGGGLIGWSLATLLADLVGRWLATLIFLVVGLAGLGLIFRLQMGDSYSWASNTPPPEPIKPTQPQPEVGRHFNTPKPAKKQTAKKVVQPGPTLTAAEAVEAAARTPGGGRVKLPPLDLLAPSAETPGEKADARYQAQIIEETLQGFGVPAEVVEVNVGPTVTQFGVKPGTVSRRLSDGTVLEQRIRVSKISSLANDLALALAAAPIRIETPVPGRPIVGVEVPNGAPTLVSLRGSMESDEYRRSKGVLKVALGRGTAGEVAAVDIVALPHLLIAGATGSGKSACINAIITSLLMTNDPEDLKMLMIDPKMVELTSYNGIPHLIAPVVTQFDQVAGALAWVTREMERRYKAFAASGSRSISGYNRKVGRKERLPYLVVIIDELADLMMLAADEVERHICRIAQMARATGIHMVIATQRPSTDVVTGLIKANFPARIAFAVASQIDSRVILDTPGAERLLGKGDMLYMAPDSPKLARIQGSFVSDPEINNVVDYWKRARLTLAAAPNEVDIEAEDDEDKKLPWDDLVKEANQDDLLKEAIKLVVEAGRASTTLLQRRLGIGYPRASRLMDQLEAEGVIGPADGTNPREVHWQQDDVEA